MFEGLAGEVTFQAPHDFCGIESFLSSACHLLTGLLMAAHTGEDDPVDGGVGLSVTPRLSRNLVVT